MKEKGSRVLGWVKKHKVVSSLGAVVVVLVVLSLLGGSTTPEYELYTVAPTYLSEEVSLTGKVKATEEVSLAFEKGGRIASIPYSVGETVARGAVLASVSAGDSYAALLEAQAAAKREEAEYAALVRGSRPEELTISSLKVEKAAADLRQARQTLVDTVRDAYTKSDDAIRNKVDQLFTNPRAANPQLIFQTDSALELALETGRVGIEEMLVGWASSVAALSQLIDNDPLIALSEKNLSATKTYLDKVALSVNGLTSNSSLSQTTIDGWKADVSTARTNANTARTNFTSAVEGVQSARAALAIAENEYSLAKSGASTEDLAAGLASLEQARAAVANAEAVYAKNILRSPIAGVVTKVNAELGEIVAANTEIVSVISLGNYEIEAFVPEADIAKIKLGDKSEVTLDAYGSLEDFAATVIKVDPAETIIDGVPTYRVKLQFENQDERIKSGMTANLTIATAERLGVLSVPGRAVKTEGGKRLVTIVNTDGSTEDREVMIGLRSSSGAVEITSGLVEGEQVAVGLKK